MKKNNADSNSVPLLIEKKDRHCNKHRLSKISVQAYLSDEEIALVDHIKEQRNFSSYRELLVKLCQEAEEQVHQVFDPIEMKAEIKFKPIKSQQETKKHARGQPGYV